MRFCFVFVLGFLVRVLEEHCCRLNWESTWVFETILEIGILLPVLHRIYDRIFKAKVTAVLIVYSSHYRDTLIHNCCAFFIVQLKLNDSTLYRPNLKTFYSSYK
jgi:hypothetical protein